MLGQPAPAVAAVNDYRFATWNMQGAGGGSKWTEDILGMLDDRSGGGPRNAVVSLQEAGNLPADSSINPIVDHTVTAEYTDFSDRTLPVQNTINYTVRQYNFGSASRPTHTLFWMQTDTGGTATNPGRVNMAIIVRNSAVSGTVTPLVVQPDTMNGNGQAGSGTLPRPMIGVRIGNDSFYSVHGFSGNGNDRDNAIRAVMDRGSVSGGDWAVAGDFNYNLMGANAAGQRNTWNPPGGHLRRSGDVTHPGTGGSQDSELDYAVTSTPPAPGTTTQRMAVLGSDHFGVQFNSPMRAMAEPGYTYRFRDYSTDGARVIEAAGDSRENGTAVKQAVWRRSLGQVWQAVRHIDVDGRVYSEFVNVNANKCLDGEPEPTTPDVLRLSIKDCLAFPGSSQLWTYEPSNHTLVNPDGRSVATDGSASYDGQQLYAYGTTAGLPWQMEPVDLRYWGSSGFPELANMAIIDKTTQRRVANSTGAYPSPVDGSPVSQGTPENNEHWRIESAGVPGWSHVVNNSSGLCLSVDPADVWSSTHRMVKDAPCAAGDYRQAWEYDDEEIRNVRGWTLLAGALQGEFLAGVIMATMTSAAKFGYVSYSPSYRPAYWSEASRGSTDRADTFLQQAMDRFASGSALRVPQSYTGGHFAPGDEFGPTGYQASFTYDNALIITAFLQRRSGEDVSHAIALGDSLLYAQAHDINPDGRLRASYEPEPFVTASGTPYVGSFSVYTGNMAWAGMAFTRLYRATGQQRFLDGALKAAHWIQDHSADGRGQGGYTGGERNADETGAEMIPIQWKATEHNIDTGAFFAMLAATSGDQVWKSRSDNAFSFVRSMQADDGRLWTGTGLDGVTQNRDTVPEDVQTWSYLATLDPAYSRSIDWAATNLAATDGPYTGVSFGRTDTSKVWFEGTAHLLAAYNARRADGDDAKASVLLNTLQLAQSGAPNTDGNGLVAASRDGLTTGEGDIYYAALHTGATAWYLIAANGGNPFRL
ncbi:hypothetical protein J7E97_34985 [Streptomyces sp. ISL-66]|uniref:hypothetical protein n=1 Tax=Streptomyces sp. ISL-66 TaxID=2819186 RepID=UPI001BED1367|nr:hypothetical protein [Streptomyces sp. ISL-66]MBT2472918.1 hypothetical protein [Streptomyces sp. ISL-66]